MRLVPFVAFLGLVSTACGPASLTPDAGSGVEVDSSPPDLTISNVPGGSSVVFGDADGAVIGRHDVDPALALSDVRGYAPAGGSVTIVTPTGRYFTYLEVQPAQHLFLAPPVHETSSVLRALVPTWQSAAGEYRLSGPGVDGIADTSGGTAVEVDATVTRADDAPAVETLVLEAQTVETVFGILPDAPLASPDLVDLTHHAFSWQSAGQLTFTIDGSGSRTPTGYRLTVDGPDYTWTTSGGIAGEPFTVLAPDVIDDALSLDLGSGAGGETVTFSRPLSEVDLTGLQLPSITAVTLQGRRVSWVTGDGVVPTAVHLRVDGYWDVVSPYHDGGLSIPSLPADLEPTSPLGGATMDLVLTSSGYADYATGTRAFDPHAYVTSVPTDRAEIRAITPAVP